MLRHLLVASAGAVLALSVGAAGAYFTAQIQVADSIIKAGTIQVASEPATAPLSIDPLAPGSSTVRPLNIMNAGALAADMVVTPSKKAGITAFYNILTCRVTCDGVELYDGLLSEMRTAPVRLPPGSRAELLFDVGLPASAGNTFAGNYVKLSLYIDAEQAR
jgi:hypothetical protein